MRKIGFLFVLCLGVIAIGCSPKVESSSDVIDPNNLKPPEVPKGMEGKAAMGGAGDGTSARSAVDMTAQPAGEPPANR